MNFSYDISYQNESAESREYEVQRQRESGFPEKKGKLSKPSRTKFKIAFYEWSKTEQKRYILFLKANKDLFYLSVQQKKVLKINVMMSASIKSRTAAQCHSHHQKMMIKHKSIEAIIERHSHLFEKAVKNTIKQEAESEQLMFKGSEQPPVQFYSEPQPEPLWWKYIDLADQREHSLWDQSLPQFC